MSVHEDVPHMYDCVCPKCDPEPTPEQKAALEADCALWQQVVDLVAAEIMAARAERDRACIARDEMGAAFNALKTERDRLLAQVTDLGRDVIRQVEAEIKCGKLVNDLLAERNRLRHAVAWAYQLAGARFPNVAALDNLSDLSQGLDAVHPWPVIGPSAETELREALAAVEWSGPMQTCLHCKHPASFTHAPDCIVGKAMGGAK